MLYQSYAKVKSVGAYGSTLDVVDLDSGESYGINGPELVEKCFSSDQFEETKKVTKTELIETLVASYNTPLTVNFTKEDGSDRTLRGRLVKPEPLFGKSLLEDLDLDKNRLRYVIHENVKSAVINGVKLVRKK